VHQLDIKVLKIDLLLVLLRMVQLRHAN